MRLHHENRNLHRSINGHYCIQLASALRLWGDLMKSYKSNIRISAKVPVNSAKNMADGSWRDELLGKVYGSDNGKLFGLIDYDKNPYLDKSRFEGDNFRKRYMSKCQWESTADRLKRIEGAAKLSVSSYYNYDKQRFKDDMYNLHEELKQ